MTSYNLLPNESIIMKESCVAHGGLWAAYTDELILTNINLVCVGRGIFGNKKKTFVWPLNQVKLYNGKPQAIMGELSNGTKDLEVYFINGSESFNFQSGNNSKIKTWIKAITKVICGDIDEDEEMDEEDEVDPDSIAGVFMEIGDEFKDMKNDFMDVFGFKPKKKKQAGKESQEKITKKCISCSAPLIGYKGQTVKCKYCDTKQTL